MFKADIRRAHDQDDRGAVRTRLLVEATSDAQSGSPIDIVVHDLSVTGILFAADRLFDLQSPILIDVQGIGSMIAKVVWSGGVFQGAEFVTPLSAATLEAMLQRSKVIWPAFSGSPATVTHRRDLSDFEAAPDALASDIAKDLRLATGIKIQLVLSLAILMWIGLAFGALSLIA